MTEVVERVNLLEEALTKLAYAQFNLHIEMDRLILEGQASRERSEREMADFKDEMRASRERSEKETADFKDEMRASRERSEKEMVDFKDEMRASRERSEKETADFKDEMRASRERSEKETADFKDEMRASRERSEKEMVDFKAEMTAFKDEMRASRERSEKEMVDFKAEMTAFKDEMRASRERSEKEMVDFKAEMTAFKDEMRADRRAMHKRWGEIANRLGTIVEDIVLPNIPRIAREHFGAGELEFMGARIRKQHPAEPDRMREFDVVAAWPGSVLFNETKGGAMRPEYLTNFAAFIRSGDFFGFFPEYTGRRLVPVFSALALAESDVRYLTREGIYALTMGDETMEIVNLAEVGQPRQG